MLYDLQIAPNLRSHAQHFIPIIVIYFMIVVIIIIAIFIRRAMLKAHMYVLCPEEFVYEIILAVVPLSMPPTFSM